jgi:hypothetical protein
MPVFFFNLRGPGFDVPDLAGREFPDAAAARAEAERLAAELAETALASGEISEGATVEVDDEEQRPVLALPIGQAVGA